MIHNSSPQLRGGAAEQADRRRRATHQPTAWVSNWHFKIFKLALAWSPPSGLLQHFFDRGLLAGSCQEGPGSLQSVLDQKAALSSTWRYADCGAKLLPPPAAPPPPCATTAALGADRDLI